MKTFVVCNPAAGGGRAGRLWPEIARRLPDAIGTFDEAHAQHRAHTIALVSHAARNGYRHIVAVGGDGTIGEAVDGLFAAAGGQHSDVTFGFVSCGTGNDFRRTFGIEDSIDSAIGRLKSAVGRRIDVGRVTFVRDDGGEGIRHFCNIASFGLSGATDRAVCGATVSRLLGAKGLFAFQAVLTLLRYRFPRVAITVDATELDPTEITTVAVANGRYFGGGMKVAPGADPSDEAFEVIIVRATGKREIAGRIGLMYSGAHLTLPFVSAVRGRVIRARSLDDRTPVLLDIDGEAPGRLPATFEILPGALMVRC